MKHRKHGTVDILIPKGYISGTETVDELKHAIEKLIESSRTSLLVNLSETKHLSSPALRVLIEAHTNYARRGGSMVLCSVDKRIENLLVITKLSLVFNVYPSEELALASFE